MQGCSARLLYFNTWSVWTPVVTWQRTSTQNTAVAAPPTQTIAISIKLDADVSMVLGDSIVFSDWHEPSSSMTPRFQHGPWWQPVPQASAQPLVVIRATDISADPYYNSAIDSDMALCSSSDRSTPQPSDQYGSRQWLIFWSPTWTTAT